MVSKGIPKALMPVGDKLYLDLLLDKIFYYQIEHVYLSLCYKPELFDSYLKNCHYRNKISVNVEPVPLGTGGAINHVINNSTIKSPFFVINGDSLSDINLEKMAFNFDDSNINSMIAISKVKNTRRYGVVIEKNDSVLSFSEKGNKGEGWINNGYYIFKREAFNKFSGAFSLEKDLFPKLVQKKKLGVFKVANSNFIDMGVPEDYFKLCNNYMEGK